MRHALLITALLVCVAAQPAALDIHAAPQDREVTYCSPNGLELKMNLYYPPATRQTTSQATPQTTPPPQRLPVVVFIHGGSWTSGSRIAGWTVAQLLTDSGFAAASISYRLGPQHRFPAMIEDAKCAIRYLRANAAALHIDPDHIGVIGVSAGGHLAELLATTAANPSFEGRGGYSAHASHVQAAIALYAPSDLADRTLDRSQGRYLSAVFGDMEARRAASPIQYVSSRAAPILLIHGDTDFIVPLAQSITFYDRLKAAGVAASLVVVHNAGHGLKEEGQIQPTLGEINRIMLAFLRKYLKNG